jgi:anti-anti-sigma factor
MSSSGHEGMPPIENPRESEIEELYCPGTESEGRITSYVQDGVIYVSAAGDMDLHSAPTLSEVIDRQTSSYPNIAKAEIDISEATFVDSMTLGVLIGAYRKISSAANVSGEKSHATIKVSDLGVARIFELTMLDRVFEVELIGPEEPPEVA